MANLPRIFLGLVLLVCGLWETSSFGGVAARECRLTSHFDGNGRLLGITAEFNGCSPDDLSKMSVALPARVRGYFDQKVKEAYGIGNAIIANRCETRNCVPCSVNPSGVCDRYSRLPHAFFSVAMKQPRVSEPQRKSGQDYLEGLGIGQREPVKDHSFVVVAIPNSDPAISREEMESAIGATYTIVSFAQAVPEILELGNRIRRSWNIIVKGEKVIDDKAVAAMALQQRMLAEILQQGLDDIRQATEDTMTANQNIVNSYEIAFADTQAALGNLAKTVQEVSASLASARGSVENATRIVDEITNVQISAAGATSEELARVRAGLLTKEAYSKLIANLQEATVKEMPGSMARKLSQLQGSVASYDAKPALREQYLNILRAITDRNGLVKAWAAVCGISSDLTLRTDEFSQVGRAVRQNFNEAIGLLAKGTAKSTEMSPEFAIEQLIQADQLLARGDKRQGDRLLNQARAMLDFATGNERVASYNALELTAAAKQLFRITPTKSMNSGYQSYETRLIANRFSLIADDRLDSRTYMAMQLTTRQLYVAGQDSDAKMYNNALRNAYSVLDFAEGFGSGLIGGLKATTHGVIEMVAHPIDTIEGLTNAVINYEATFTALVEATAKFLTDFPNATAAEYGQMAGRTAFEIASLFVAEGIVAKGVDIAELAKSAVIVRAAERMEPVAERIGYTAKNVKPKLGDKYVTELPDLDGSLKEAFDGNIFKGTYEPGEILFQAQRTGANATGNWFGPIRPINSDHAEALFNIKKWGNDAGQIKAFVVKERVSGYAGKVAGGEGHQFYIPRGVKLEDVVQEVK